MSLRRADGFREVLIEIEDSKQMWICQDCLEDSVLKKLLSGVLVERVCTICSLSKKNVLHPERISNFIWEYLPQHFIVDIGLYPGYELSLTDVVSRMIGCNDRRICDAIAEELVDPKAKEDDFYWRGQEYSIKSSPFDSEEHERWYVVGDWKSIASELTHGRRFFNDKARRFFDLLIWEVLNAKDAPCSEARPVVKTMSIGSAFYRARISNSAQEAKAFKDTPAACLGAPPREISVNNRMSVAGVSPLYLSENINTCISEVRPVIGDLVVVGKFFSRSTLKIFDFTALKKGLEHVPLSYLDPRYEERVMYRALLNYLHEEISRPVRVGGIDYVVTQALAEFIRYETDVEFDGIAFSSAQCQGGVNYVLFDKDVQDGVNISSRSPQFDFDISSEDITFHRVNAVHYEHTIANDDIR